MSHPIEPSTLRILTPDGKTVGTGFLVSQTLVVTCMHVVSLAGLDADGRVSIQFTGQKHPTTAIWLDQYSISGTDVAILQVKTVPSGVSRLGAQLYRQTFCHPIIFPSQKTRSAS